MSKLVLTIAAVVGCLLIGISTASARPIGNRSIPDDFGAVRLSGERPAARHVEESRPVIFFLPDKEGKLQPVLDFSYEDFEELYKLKHRLGRRTVPPRYVLQSISAEGDVRDNRAELAVRFQVLVRDDGWVRVPLRLDQGLLCGSARYKGPGRQFIDCEADGSGYVSWIKGKSDTPHEISLAVLVPLDSVGDETRLKLYFPRAGSSELKLTVPVTGAIGSVSEDAALLASKSSEKDTTEFSAARVSGDFQFTWSKPAESGVETPAVLEAVETILARSDGRGISSEATLSVRSLAAPFDRFTVKLPPGAELVTPPVKAPGYDVVPISPEDKEKETQRTVEVRLAKKTVDPVEVRIACRREINPSENEDEWIELAGFEVVAAARQWGTIAIAADSRRQILWGPTEQTRQVYPLPEGFQKENAVAAFEYFGQPFSLTVKLAPQVMRLAVEPQYTVLVERNRIKLDGKLSYTVRGGEVSKVMLDVPEDWEIDLIGPERLVAGDGVTVNGEQVSIPLVRPVNGPFELRLRASQAVDDKADSLRFSFPHPKADNATAAEVAVSAADNVELTPNDEQIKGLVRQTGRPPMALPAWRQAPLYYRGSQSPGVFAADFRVHRRRIAVEADGQVALDEGGAMVRQKFSYNIFFEPVGHLMLEMPRELTAPGRLQAFLDGKPLLLVLVGDDQMTPVSLKAILPEARIGPCELTLQYNMASDAPSPEQSAAATIPLVAPADGELISNRLTVRAGRNIRPLPRGDAWIVAGRDGAAYNAREGIRLTAPSRRNALDLDLLRRKDAASETLVVDRALVQSWFTSSARQDRAVFQFATAREEIEIALPAGAAAEQAKASIDGRAVAPRVLGDNSLVVPLGGGDDIRRITLELRYHFNASRPKPGAINLETPRLKPDVWLRKIYQQIILPPNEHLLVAPAGWTGEYVWNWNGGLWSRRQSIEQSDLEKWAGATALDPRIKRTNRYLFSSFGNPAAEIRTAGRTWLVLWASGAALIVGLTLIYIPAFRHPAALFVGGVALLAAGAIAPEPTLLAAQAAVLGLVLALLAGLLQRGVIGRYQTAPRKDSSSTRIELGSKKMVLSPGVEKPLSTESSPTAAQQSTGNYQP